MLKQTPLNAAHRVYADAEKTAHRHVEVEIRRYAA